MTLEKHAHTTASAVAHHDPLSLEDSAARWVSVPARARLRQSFRIDAPVEHARLYLTGQGLVRAELNGRPVNADRLDPTRTDASRALYRDYDVSALVVQGANDLDFLLAVGEWSRTGLDPRLLAELVIDNTDGTRSRITPNETARISTSRI